MTLAMTRFLRPLQVLGSAMMLVACGVSDPSQQSSPGPTSRSLPLPSYESLFLASGTGITPYTPLGLWGRTFSEGATRIDARMRIEGSRLMVVHRCRFPDGSELTVGTTVSMAMSYDGAGYKLRVLENKPVRQAGARANSCEVDPSGENTLVVSYDKLKMNAGDFVKLGDLDFSEAVADEVAGSLFRTGIPKALASLRELRGVFFLPEGKAGPYSETRIHLHGAEVRIARLCFGIDGTITHSSAGGTYKHQPGRTIGGSEEGTIEFAASDIVRSEACALRDFNRYKVYRWSLLPLDGGVSGAIQLGADKAAISDMFVLLGNP